MLKEFLEGVGQWVVDAISSLGYGGIVGLMAIESACIPLPSEIIMPFSGYLVHLGRFDFHIASLAGAVGCAVGSTAAYVVGFWGGRPLVERYGKYILLRQHEFELADRWFARHGEWVVFVSRLVPVVRTFISLPAGIARMNFPRFLIYSFLGSVPWCYFLAYVGWMLGAHWRDIAKYFHRADVVVIAAVCLAVAYWWFRRRRRLRAEASG